MIYLVVHDTPPGVCLFDMRSSMFLTFTLRQECLSSCSLRHAISPLTRSLPLITIQRLLNNKHSRNAGRKEKGQRRFRRGLYLVCVAQVSVVVICRFFWAWQGALSSSSRSEQYNVVCNSREIGMQELTELMLGMLKKRLVENSRCLKFYYW